MEFLNEIDEEQLDDEFRRILCIIKQHIPHINSNYQLTLYSSWLEKLSAADNEKIERNIYLFELARQIKSNRLLPPFDHPPPKVSLKNLPKINLFRPYGIENQIGINKGSLNTFNPESISHMYEGSSTFPQQQFIDSHQKTVPSPPPEYKDNMQTIFMQPKECFYYHPCYADDTTNIAAERIKSSTPIKKKKSKIARNAQKSFCNDLTNKHEIISAKALEKDDHHQNYIQTDSVVEEDFPVKDDSSWCDLTDTSETSFSTLASGDNKKCSPKVQEKVKQFGEMIKIKTNQNNQTCLPSHEKNKTGLPDEVEKNSYRIKYLNDAKESLKDTNFISSDWKKTIEALQLRLTETLNQNNDLKSIINALQVTLKEEVTKNKEQKDSKLKKGDLHKKEIEALQQIQVENVKELEKSFRVKLGEAERSYQHKIEKLKTNYETKIKELNHKHEYSKKEKNQEMCCLSEIIQQQCIRMSNEIAALRKQIENSFSNCNDNDKVIVLQKCVSKMDKLFHKSEKEYQKQLDKLKQELDLKDKVMQIQLKTQRAELITRTSVEKQKQFDDVINNLEIKYIKMLEFHEDQVMASKGQDEEQIEHLKNLLEENNITYNTFS